jgi:hypothetical protein
MTISCSIVCSQIELALQLVTLSDYRFLIQILDLSGNVNICIQIMRNRPNVKYYSCFQMLFEIRTNLLVFQIHIAVSNPDKFLQTSNGQHFSTELDCCSIKEILYYM